MLLLYPVELQALYRPLSVPRTPTGTALSGGPGLIADDAQHLVARKLLPAREERELDEEGVGRDPCPQALGQLGSGARGAAGRDHVVHHHDRLARQERVL